MPTMTTASKTTVYLGRKSRLGKIVFDAGRLHVGGPLSRNRLWASGRLNLRGRRSVLLWQTGVIYPDSADELEQDEDTGVWSFTDDNGDHVSTTYDRLGRVHTTTDQNNTSLGASQQRGVTHTYTYDSAGRLALDAVTIPVASTGVDDSVLSVKTQYDDFGRVQKVTSCPNDDGTGTPVNEVQYAYDGWGNVSREWQSHSGAVVTGTTPSVQYTYADGAVDGVAKYVRLTDVIYPNGRDVQYGYGTTGTIDDIMSRLASVSDSSNGDLAEYTYFGLGTIVKESHPGVSGGLNLDYDPDGDNSFSGFDRFGRVVDQLWANDAGTPIDEYKYGYDRAGNVAWKQNVAAVGKALDELYSYDQLDRLTNTQRGTLDFTDPDDPTITSQAKYQDWTLDGLGNFSEFDDNGTSQTRDVNGANEITSTTGITTPTYDAAGNIISDGTFKYEYDAWNRQTVVRHVSDNSLVATYSYDGQSHRVVKALADGTTTNYFYNDQWQIVEERTQSGETTTVNQYVWDQGYVDSPIVRLHDGNNDSDCNPATDTNDTVRYYTSDANYNVTTTITVGHASTETQHVVYDAYGKAKVSAADWTGAADPTTDGPLYCGYFFDAESGNYQVERRFYSVLLATWLSRDPIEYDINLYRYCANNPLIYTDPTGEALTSIDGAVEACMKKPTAVARADCLEALIDIFKNGSYDLTKLTKCAKSMRDLANHLQKLKNAQNQLSQLQQALKTAKGKTVQEALKKAIDALQKSIKGHIKEIGQKWGGDALKECSCPK